MTSIVRSFVGGDVLIAPLAGGDTGPYAGYLQGDILITPRAGGNTGPYDCSPKPFPSSSFSSSSTRWDRASSRSATGFSTLVWSTSSA